MELLNIGPLDDGIYMLDDEPIDILVVAVGRVETDGPIGLVCMDGP
jgi:hypothetical protein